MMEDSSSRPFGPGNLEGQGPELGAGRDAELQALRQQVKQLVSHQSHRFSGSAQAGGRAAWGLEEIQTGHGLSCRCRARVVSSTGVCLAPCPSCAGTSAAAGSMGCLPASVAATSAPAVLWCSHTHLEARC